MTSCEKTLSKKLYENPTQHCNIPHKAVGIEGDFAELGRWVEAKRANTLCTNYQHKQGIGEQGSIDFFSSTMVVLIPE